MQKTDFWVKLGSGIFYTTDTYTPTNEKYIPPPSWRQRGGHGGFFEGVGTRCTEWVWRSGWADACCVTHQTPCRGPVQVQRRHAVAKWSGAASESCNLVRKRGGADEMGWKPCRGLPSFLEEKKKVTQQLLPPLGLFCVAASQFKCWARSEYTCFVHYLTTSVDQTLF